MPPNEGSLRAKIAIAATGVLLSVGLLSPTQASAIDHVNTSKLRKAVTVSGILQHERALQRIANNNDGTRASGTPGYKASANYVVKKLRKAGYKVKRQTFTFPFFDELAPAELSVSSPNARDIDAATFTYSGSGTVEGQVIAIGGIVIPPTADPSSASGCAASDFPAAPSGPAIALIQRGTCTFEEKVQNAETAGYDAVIIFNEGQPGRQELLEGTLGTPQNLPAIGISFADGEALYQETQAGDVTAQVVTSTVNEERKTQNIIADSPKGKIKGQTIVVGAHLDSVTAGPGINDNGSGSATILEIAEQLAKLKYTKKLQRQVRFAFWGAEELNLLGSTHYVDHLTTAQRAKIYANLNFDMLGSPNYVRFVYDGDGSDTPDAGPLDLMRSSRSSLTTSRAKAWPRNQRHSMAGPITVRSLRLAFQRVDSSAVRRRSRLRRKPPSTEARLAWRTTSATTRRATPSITSTQRRSPSWATRPLMPR